MESEPASRRPAAGFSPLLFVGFAIASIGGPLALPNFLPGTAGDEGIESGGPRRPARARCLHCTARPLARVFAAHCLTRRIDRVRRGGRRTQSGACPRVDLGVRVLPLFALHDHVRRLRRPHAYLSRDCIPIAGCSSLFSLSRSSARAGALASRPRGAGAGRAGAAPAHARARGRHALPRTGALRARSEPRPDR